MSIDWEEMDRLDAFGTFGGRIVPYNGTWKIYLNETNSELWSFKTHPEAEAKLAEAIKQSGYSDDENPLVELARLKAPRPEEKPIAWVVAVEEEGRMFVHGPQYLSRMGAEQDARLPMARGQKAEVWECFAVSPQKTIDG